MTRLDGARMDGSNGNLMHPVAFDLEKGVRFGDDRKLSVAFKVAAEWKNAFGPSTVAQPSAMVGFHALDAKQIKDCAFHPQCAWKELVKAGIDWPRPVFHFVFVTATPSALR